MDASAFPVLSLWTADAHASGGRGPRVGEGMPRVDGIAGDPGQALRRAAEQYPGRDVLLLRDDAELSEGAWRALAAAWRESAWDVLSPVDGGWPVFDAGTAADDGAALAWALAEHASFAHGHVSTVCSLWRASSLAHRHDAAALQRGLLPCAYVGPALPPREDELPLPLSNLRLRVATFAGSLPATPLPPGSPTLLHVLHDWGGGVQQFARDLASADRGRQHLLLLARGDDHLQPYGRRLHLLLHPDGPSLRTWTLADPINTTAARSTEVDSVLREIIAEWGVGSVLVSSLIGHSLDVLHTGLPTAVCVHDNYPAWPLLHDDRDPATSPFDEPALARGLAAAGPRFVLAGADAAQWMALRAAFEVALARANATLVAPSDFARQRLCAIAPALANHAWRIVPHGLAPLAARGRAPGTRPADAPLRVLVLGRIEGGKGERLLGPLLESLPDGVELVLLGSGHAGARFEGRRHVQVHRDYARDDLPRWMDQIAPDLVLLPSTVPETFSYTLSEMLALRVPVLCASPGAPVERLQASGGGWVVAPDADAVNRQLAYLAQHREEISAMAARPAPAQATLEDMAEGWRAALPPASTPLRLAPALPARAVVLALEAGASAQGLRLQATVGELAEANEELARRADWAHDLQAQLALAAERYGASGAESRFQAAQAAHQVEMQRLLDQDAARAAELARLAAQVAERDAEVSRLIADYTRMDHDLAEAQSGSARMEDLIRELDTQLADAHGYYQRDSTDLARQRDVALRQRDEAQSLLDAIRSSVAWRMTALPRKLGTWLRNAAAANLYRIRHYSQLAARGLASLRTRGIQPTWRRVMQLRASRQDVSHVPVLATVDALEMALRLPRPRMPRASIIVPVFNQLPYTLACLRSLSDCGDATAFEVIVVDDASTDASARVLPSIPGLRYHRNLQNLGFIGSCNAGAELAAGDFVVFLNNDTTVTPGWLDALLDTFRLHPDTGLAGSKLVYPDGRLQEAGGIVFADGSGWNYGRFEDPAHPRFNFVREVDYCSGASIALRRSQFLQLGGFDSHYAPAYYEDTDLAMRVRQAGMKVRYQPASTVVHHEGVSSGTDLAKGIKAYQVSNHRKFLERWQAELAASHRPAGSDPEVASERGRRHRVLVMDACTPTPDRDSGSLRMLALMRALRDEGCSVVFFPENTAHDGAYTRALQQLGVEAWWHPFLADVPGWMARHGSRFDLVVGSRHYVLSPVLPLVRTHAPGAHVVFDTVDLHHLREQREADVSGDAGQARKAARTRRVELGLVGQCDTTWVVSGAEKELLARELPAARVEVVSNIHDVHGPGRPWAERSDLLFVGGYRHPPNVDAALWMARDIFPLVRERLPTAVLHLVGADAPPEVEALASLPGVRLHGFVPDLTSMLEGTRVGVAPLRYGAGVKGKVNHSLAHGQPMVATLCAVEGMHLMDGVDVLVADEAPAFAAAVVRLYEDRALWETLSAGGLENTRRHFSPAAVRATLATLLSRLPPR